MVSVTRRDEARLALLREALINREPFTTDLTPTLRVAANELLRRGTAEVTFGNETCTVTLKPQRTDVQNNAVRAARQVLVWLEAGKKFSVDGAVDRMAETLGPEAAQRGVGWLKARGLIDTSRGFVADETGKEFRPEHRDPDTIGELVSVLKPEPEPEPETPPAAPKTADAKPVLPHTVLTDDMSPAEMTQRFQRYYARNSEETSRIMGTLRWVVRTVTEQGGTLVVGSDTWDQMNTAVYGVMWDFVRILEAAGHLVRFEVDGQPAFRPA